MRILAICVILLASEVLGDSTIVVPSKVGMPTPTQAASTMSVRLGQGSRMCVGMADGSTTCLCTPETNAQMCARYGYVCGGLSGTDNCGAGRSIGSCGTCPAYTNESCNSGVCSCSPWNCSSYGYSCGTPYVGDGCGGTINYSCGTCSGYNSCGGGGSSYVCGCTPTTCGALGDNCGNPPDNCGGSLSSCGTCSGYNTCGGGGSPYHCGCTPATCGSLGDNCGNPSDGCGGTLSCGTCTSPQTCGGGGTPSHCGCTDTSPDYIICGNYSYYCGGIVTLNDSCGVPRSVNCGTCTSPDVCVSTPFHYCCTPYSDSTLCSNGGYVCGTPTVTDNCGQVRTPSCGSCAGPCENTSHCCGYTDAQLCTNNGFSCGDHVVNDNCGVSRTIRCGGCSGGGVCEPNGTCCSQSDSNFCTEGGGCGTGGCGLTGPCTSKCSSRCTSYGGNPVVTDSCGFPRIVNCQSYCGCPGGC